MKNKNVRKRLETAFLAAKELKRANVWFHELGINFDSNSVEEDIKIFRIVKKVAQKFDCDTLKFVPDDYDEPKKTVVCISFLENGKMRTLVQFPNEKHITRYITDQIGKGGAK